MRKKVGVKRFERGTQFKHHSDCEEKWEDMGKSSYTIEEKEKKEEEKNRQNNLDFEMKGKYEIENCQKMCI